MEDYVLEYSKPHGRRKPCSKCGTNDWLPTMRRGKPTWHCRACNNANARAWHKKNRARRRAYDLAHQKERMAYRYRYPERMVYYNAKQRAAATGTAFTIKFADVVIPERCPVLGIPIIPPTAPGQKRGDNAPSLDRLDSSRGYVPGNVHVISWRANAVKNNGTAAEHRAIADWMTRELAER